MPCKCSTWWGEAERHTFWLMSFFLGGNPGTGSVSHQGTSPPRLWLGCSERLVGLREGARASSLMGWCLLGLAKLFVSLYLLICKMGYFNNSHGRENSWVLWIREALWGCRAVSERLGGVVNVCDGRCCRLASLAGLWPLGLWRLQIWGRCWASACTSHLALAHVFFSLRKSQKKACLRLHTKTCVGALLLLCHLVGRVCVHVYNFCWRWNETISRFAARKIIPFLSFVFAGKLALAPSLKCDNSTVTMSLAAFLCHWKGLLQLGWVFFLVFFSIIFPLEFIRDRFSAQVEFRNLFALSSPDLTGRVRRQVAMRGGGSPGRLFLKWSRTSSISISRVPFAIQESWSPLTTTIPSYWISLFQITGDSYLC